MQRRLLERRLGRVGGGAVEVVTAADITEARAAVGPFDLVICDFELPGGATAFDVRLAWPDVPMIVVSGWPRPPVYEGQWLMKPFAAEQLMGMIAQELKGWPE